MPKRQKSGAKDGDADENDSNAGSASAKSGSGSKRSRASGDSDDVVIVDDAGDTKSSDAIASMSDSFHAEHGQRMLAVEIAQVLQIVKTHLETISAEQNVHANMPQMFTPVQRLFHEVLNRYHLREQYDKIVKDVAAKNVLHFPLDQLQELKRLISHFLGEMNIDVGVEAHWLSQMPRRKTDKAIEEEYGKFTSKMQIISIFNNKGGVSKTTTAAALGYALAQKGKRVLVVDLDAQMNLSQLLLTDDQLDRISEESRPEAPRHIGDALSPAFTDGSNLRPKAVMLQKRFSFQNNGCLFVLPGSFEVDQFESRLCEAYGSRGSRCSDSLGTLLRVCQLTEMQYDGFDYCLLDLSPSIRELNQNALMLSDFFITPCSPDVFSTKAIQRLASILPRWREKHEFLLQYPPDRGYAYPLSLRVPKFLGSTVLRFSQRNMTPSLVVRLFCRRIESEVETKMIRELFPKHMALEESQYVGDADDRHCIAKLHDFNRAAQLSHYHKVPVNGLCKEHITQPKAIDHGFEVHEPLKGQHRTTLISQVAKIQRIFAQMADRVEGMVQAANQPT